MGAEGEDALAERAKSPARATASGGSLLVAPQLRSQAGREHKQSGADTRHRMARTSAAVVDSDPPQPPQQKQYDGIRPSQQLPTVNPRTLLRLSSTTCSRRRARVATPPPACRARAPNPRQKHCRAILVSPRPYFTPRSPVLLRQEPSADATLQARRAPAQGVGLLLVKPLRKDQAQIAIAALVKFEGEVTRQDLRDVCHHEDAFEAYPLPANPPAFTAHAIFR